MSRHTRKQNITAICYDKRGRVLSVGKNSYVKTHPIQARAAEKVGESGRIYLHAEIDALIKARRWDNIHKIVIFRYNRQGKPLLAKPCNICTSVIASAGIKLVEYTQ